MASIKKSLKKARGYRKARKTSQASTAYSARRQISLGFIAILTILVVVAVIAVQKAQIFKSEATGTCAEQAARAYDDCIGYGANIAHINVEGYCEQLKNQVNRICSSGANTNLVDISRPRPTQSFFPTNAQVAPTRTNTNLPIGGDSVGPSTTIPRPTGHCTPIRTAPVITSPAGPNSSGTINMTPGTHSIKWRVAAGQKGGVAVIDDVSNPFKNCNQLNTGDACRVPESKGRTNTVSYNFKRGRKYNIRVATVNCGVVSNLSSRLKIVVGQQATASPTPTP